MKDIAKRFPENPLLSPIDLKASEEGLQIICLLNPGVFKYQDKTFKEDNTVQLLETINELLTCVETSLDKATIINLGLKIADFGVSQIEQQRIPYDNHCQDITLNGVYYLKWDKDYTIKELQKFLR